ncbi:hypothetical protein [Xylanimonas sp. McL0601]|uniref:hypothetical protein n=1 Tax=Xylanimonas sp. McL0601 TaxID=3414739 RepID=UPI003CECCD53
MSSLLSREVLDLTVIDRDFSHDLYAYNAAVCDRFADDTVPPSPGTLEHQPDLTEFVD